MANSLKRVEGFDSLERKLSSLGIKTAQKVLRSALRSAMQPAKKQYEATIVVGDEPHRTYKGRLVAPGFAKQSIRVVTTRIENGTASALLGVRNEAFYIVQFIERGWSGGPARPRLGPAFRQTKDQAIEILRDKLGKGIDREAAKK